MKKDIKRQKYFHPSILIMAHAVCYYTRGYIELGRFHSESHLVITKDRPSYQSYWWYKNECPSNCYRNGLANCFGWLSNLEVIWNCRRYFRGVSNSWDYRHLIHKNLTITNPPKFTASTSPNRIDKRRILLWRRWKTYIISKVSRAARNQGKSKTAASSPKGRHGMIYVITYDLNQGVFHSYTSFLNEIQSLGPWEKYMDRTWIVATHIGLQEISDRLTRHLGQPDRLLIVRLEALQYQGWLPPEAWDWINRHYPEYGYY